MKYIIYYFYLKWLFKPTEIITKLSLNNVKRIFYGIHARDAAFKGKSAYTLEELQVLYGVMDSKLDNFTIHMFAVVWGNKTITPMVLKDILDMANMQLPCLGVNRYLDVNSHYNTDVTTEVFIKNNLPNVLHPGNKLYQMLKAIGICDNDFIEFYNLIDIITTILANAIHVHTNRYNSWILIAKTIHRIVSGITSLNKLHFTLYKRNVIWFNINDTDECELHDAQTTEVSSPMKHLAVVLDHCH